ncbi:(2Fe-2S) ferredoxin domain-containing protein [bacterium]|nr:(2Fe-2S) ferredoxin domain-containing protein [bacterium]
MPRLKVEDLAKIKEKTRKMTNLREGAGRVKITVHMGTCGIASGAREIMNTLLEEMEKQNTEDVLITTSGCAGFCSREPMATVELKGEAPVMYADLTSDKIREIFTSHVLGGTAVPAYVLGKGSERAG